MEPGGRGDRPPSAWPAAVAGRHAAVRRSPREGAGRALGVRRRRARRAAGGGWGGGGGRLRPGVLHRGDGAGAGLAAGARARPRGGFLTAVAVKEIASNRRAFHDYFIDEKHEAGIVLTGTEGKSLRAGKANLRDGFVRLDGHEAWLENVHISPYTQGGYVTHEPMRPRKLLLHRREIATLIGKTRQKGFTLIPLRMYFSGNHAKVEIGLARGKRQYDKRLALAEADAKREMERAMRR